MNRRDALRKLALGGVTAAGATAVISQPAFAYDAPTVTQNGIVEIRLVDPAPSARYDVFVTQNALASCPGSATNLPPGGAVVINRITTVTSLAMQSGFTWWANANIAGAATAVPPGATQTDSYTFRPSRSRSASVASANACRHLRGGTPPLFPVTRFGSTSPTRSSARTPTGQRGPAPRRFRTASPREW